MLNYGTNSISVAKNIVHGPTLRHFKKNKLNLKVPSAKKVLKLARFLKLVEVCVQFITSELLTLASNDFSNTQ